MSTLCWECKNATCGCSWSREFRPVEGWVATKIKASSTHPYETYSVIECPNFVRDSYNEGLKRIPKNKE